MNILHSKPIGCPLQWTLLLICIAGTSIVLYSTSNYGMGFTPDSAHYLAVGKNLAEGKGLVSFDSSLYLNWPPLFPFFIFLFEYIPVDQNEVIRWFHAVLFGFTIWMSAQILLPLLNMKWLVIPYSITMLTSVSFLSIYTFVWSEPLFIALILLLVWYFSIHERHSGFYAVTTLGGISTLICLQRYVGIVVIPIVLFCRLIQTKRMAFHHLAYLGISTIPLAIYFMRNMIYSGTVTGFRGESDYSFYYNLNVSFDIISQWLFDLDYPSWIRKLGIVFISSIAVFSSLYRYYLFQTPSKSSQLQFLLILGIIALYLASTITLSSIHQIDDISNRLLSPVFPFCALILFLGIDSFMTICQLKERHKSVLLSLLFLLFGIWIIQTGSTALRSISYSRENGVGGYTKKEYHTSPLLSSIASLHQAKIFSNSPELIYLYHEYPAYISYYQYESYEEYLNRLPLDEHAYLVWFRSEEREYIHSIATLNRLHLIRSKVEYDDGWLAVLQNPSKK